MCCAWVDKVGGAELPDPAKPLVGMPPFKELGMTKDQAREIATRLLCDTTTDPSTRTECG